VTLDGSVASADPGAGADTSEGLCANDKPGFEGSTLFSGANVAAFGSEEAVVVSTDWVVNFVLGSGAGADVPNPGKDVDAPPNRGLRGARPVSSFFGSCGADEGVRLNGSGLPVDGSLNDDGNAGWKDGAGPKLNGAGGGDFSFSELRLCARAWAATPGAGEGYIEAVNGCGITSASALSTGAGLFAT
jgi:hypothetical protein